jgi:DNA-binding transcriptional ArsR family regulator
MPSEVPSRNITDPRTLRALTHPIRLALLEALDQEGPLTATQAGELIGESPANTSFHLRTLAKYGFVEEAPGGTGRQRPWQVRHEVAAVTDADLTPEGKVAVQALVGLLHEREQKYQRRWMATRDSYPPEWRRAAGETHLTLHLTAAEVEKFNEAVRAALHPYLGRDDTPDGALPVAIATHTIPLRPPSAIPTT